MKLFHVAISFLLLLSACELPQENNLLKPPIEPTELSAIKLVREGLGFASSGRLLDAESALRQAAYLEPKAQNITINLAVVLERQGRYSEAKQIYQQLLMIPNTDDTLATRFRISLARLDVLNGDVEKGKEQFLALYNELLNRQYAPAIDLELGSITENLAAIYFTLGDEEKALCNYQLMNIHLDSLEAKTRLALSMNAFNLMDRVLKLDMSQSEGAERSGLMLQIAIAERANWLEEQKTKTEKTPFAPSKSEHILSSDSTSIEAMILDEFKKQTKLENGEQLKTDEELEDSDKPAVFADLRLQDMLTFSRLAINWPAQFEIEVAAKVDEFNKQDHAAKPWWQKITSKILN